LFLTLWLLMLLLLIAACTALGSWWLLFLLRSAAIDGCLLPPPLRLTARGGLQLRLLLRPAALSSLLSLIKSLALHPWLRLFSQSLFVILLLLMLFAACWSLTGHREALARDGRGFVFVGLHELEDLWFGRRQRHMPAGLGHSDLARKQHY